MPRSGTVALNPLLSTSISTSVSTRCHPLGVDRPIFSLFFAREKRPERLNYLTAVRFAHADLEDMIRTIIESFWGRSWKAMTITLNR